MESLKERKDNAKESLQEHCRRILETLLTHDQLKAHSAMKGKSTKKYIHKGRSKLDIVHRDNPFSIEATLE